MAEKKYYTLKEASEKLALSEHTIRYYSNMGLFRCPRDAANRRVLDDNSLNWLKGIKYLRSGGMSIADVKLYCELCRGGPATLQQRYQMMVEHEQHAKEHLREAMLAVRFSEKNVARYKELLGIAESGSAEISTEDAAGEQAEKVHSGVY